MWVVRLSVNDLTISVGGQVEEDITQSQMSRIIQEHAWCLACVFWGSFLKVINYHVAY